MIYHTCYLPTNSGPESKFYYTVLSLDLIWVVVWRLFWPFRWPVVIGTVPAGIRLEGNPYNPGQTQIIPFICPLGAKSRDVRNEATRFDLLLHRIV